MISEVFSNLTDFVILFVWSWARAVKAELLQGRQHVGSEMRWLGQRAAGLPASSHWSAAWFPRHVLKKMYLSLVFKNSNLCKTCGHICSVC